MEKRKKLKTKDRDPREYMTAEEIQKRLGITLPPERLNKAAIFRLMHPEPFMDFDNLSPQEERKLLRMAMQ